MSLGDPCRVSPGWHLDVEEDVAARFGSSAPAIMAPVNESHAWHACRFGARRPIRPRAVSWQCVLGEDTAAAPRPPFPSPLQVLHCPRTLRSGPRSFTAKMLKSPTRRNSILSEKNEWQDCHTDINRVRCIDRLPLLNIWYGTCRAPPHSFQ